MFLLVFVRHVGAHPDGHQHGVFIQISIDLGKTCFFGYCLYMKCICIVFVFYLPHITRLQYQKIQKNVGRNGEDA